MVVFSHQVPPSLCSFVPSFLPSSLSPSLQPSPPSILTFPPSSPPSSLFLSFSQSVTISIFVSLSSFVFGEGGVLQKNCSSLGWWKCTPQHYKVTQSLNWCKIFRGYQERMRAIRTNVEKEDSGLFISQKIKLKNQSLSTFWNFEELTRMWS